MPSNKVVYVCENCGYESPKWLGHCPSCGAWNSFRELKLNRVAPRAKKTGKSYKLHEVPTQRHVRVASGIGELDRVLGGGFVCGSLILLGGEPGIGKSTLLLEVASRMCGVGEKVLYVSGEESLTQLKLRADRLNVSSDIYLMSETDIEAIESEIKEIVPSFLIIDSIQAVYDPGLDALPGSISQVRTCADRFTKLAKEKNITTIVVGHVTKEGVIAGPRTLEHMVDVVLYLEGDRNYQYRIIRGVKNRYGSTNEIGVFEMTEHGLTEVRDPSMLFIQDGSKTSSPGSAVTCVLEGTRPLLVEIQSLITAATYGTPQRVGTGLDYKRLVMLLAVIDRYLGYNLSRYDVFVNVVGGLRITENATDLGVVASIASAATGHPLPVGMLFIGEVGLLGEIRPVFQLKKRIEEATRLGFKRCAIPKGQKWVTSTMELVELDHIDKLKRWLT